MELSLFVARVVALIYLSVGLGMLMNSKYYKKFAEHFFEEMAAIYISGFMALIIGFALVSYHNIWSGGWVVLVTIIGWLALLKGVAILLAPASFKSMAKGIMKNPATVAPIIIILGLVFGYFGFFSY